MPLNSPTSDTGQAVRHIHFQHKSIALMSGYLAVAVSDLNEDTTEADLDTVAQAVADMVSQSADFEFVDATKDYPTAQEITPTA